MRVALLLGLGLALACGGEAGDLFPADAGADTRVRICEETHEEQHPAPDSELGQVAQALTRPSGYGMEGGTNGTRCFLPWGSCRVNQSKTFRMRFHAGTCSNWYQTRVVNAHNTWKQDVQSLGWTIQNPGSGGSAEVHIKCKTGTSGDYLASFDHGSNEGCDSNNVCKFKYGTVHLYHEIIEAMPQWADWTDLERQVFVDNVLRHEFYHSVSLGHDDSQPLMNTYAQGDQHVYTFYLPASDRSKLQNYQP